MVQVIQRGPTLGQALGKGIENLMPYFQQQIQRSQLQNALGQIREKMNQPNISPQEMALSLMEAGAGIPGSERYIGQLYPTLMQHAMAKQAQNVPLAGELTPGGMGQMERPTREQTAPVERQALPEFMGQQSKNFPSNLPGTDQFGNLPQEATAGEKRQIYNASEMVPLAKKLSLERTRAGIPTTPKEALEEIREMNNENKLYNDQVELEKERRIASQREYGDLAASQLVKLFPEATEEQIAIFKKMGEQEAGKNRSEADIQKYLAKEATKFKNTLSNVQKDISANRSLNHFQRAFLGTQKKFDQAADDLRVKLKPILDMGLYDTARKMLSDLGYYPEERETIISPLSSKDKTAINLIPKIEKVPNISFEKGYADVPEQTYTEKQINNLTNGLKDVFKNNRDANLVLLRKGVEDQGYDWRVFKDALNNLIMNGDISLNDDQQNQISVLDSPPLNNLEKIFHGIRVIGR